LSVENRIEQDQVSALFQHSQRFSENLIEHSVRQMVDNGYAHDYINGRVGYRHPRRIGKYRKAVRDF